MARVVTIYDILISCPSDITSEVEIIKKAVDEFNNTTAYKRGFQLNTLHWKQDSYSQAGSSPQDILNEQIVKNSDAVIAVIWTRFGSPTKNYDSGTEEEITLLMKKHKNVLLYFSDKPISPSLLDKVQYDKVQEFKTKISKNILHKNFKSDDELEKILRDDLAHSFVNLYQERFESLEKEVENKKEDLDFDSDFAKALNKKTPKGKVSALKKLAEISDYKDKLEDIYFQIAYHSEYFNEQIKYYDKVIKLNTNYSNAFLYRGISKDNIKDYKGAIKDFDKAIKLNPNDFDACFTKGLTKYLLENFKGAIKDFDKAIELNPNNSDYFLYRGIVKNKLEKHMEAIKDFDKAIELNPNNYEIFCNRGNAKNKLGHFKRAIKNFDKAIELNPNYEEAFFNRGVAKDSIKDYESAIKDYNQVIILNPNSFEAFNNRGNIKYELGNYKEAIKDFDQAIKLNPNDSESFNNRGNIKDELGNYKEAIKDFDQAIILNPNFSDAFNNRGVAKENLELYEEALSDYNIALKLNPNDELIIKNIKEVKKIIAEQKKSK
ncbi:MAG: tetratricopeptide repeat protein [Fusobacteriaceae bacterium]